MNGWTNAAVAPLSFLCIRARLLRMCTAVNRCLRADTVSNRPVVFVLVRRLRVCSFDWVTPRVQEDLWHCSAVMSSLFGLATFIRMLENWFSISRLLIVNLSLITMMIGSCCSLWMLPSPLIDTALRYCWQRGFSSISRPTYSRRPVVNL